MLGGDDDPVAASGDLHHFFHALQIFLDRLHHGELRPAAVEVVTGALGFEIDVALEVVGQEADAALESEQLSREREVVDLGAVEEGRGAVEVAADQRVEAVEADADERKVGLVLAGLLIAGSSLLQYWRRLGIIAIAIAAGLGLWMIATILINDRKKDGG